LIAIAAGSALLVPAAAEAILDAKIGMNCEALLNREVSRGATITTRQESLEGLLVRLRSRFEGRRVEAMYTCQKQSIVRLFAVIYMPNEVDSIDLFHRLHDQLESELGDPFFDGTKPEDLDPFAELLDSDPESARREYRFYAHWIAKGVLQSLAVSQNQEQRWFVTISSSVKPDA
jgi:hypothetical protein